MKTCPECHAEFEDSISECPDCRAQFTDKLNESPADNAKEKSTKKNPLIGTCLVDRYQIVSLLGSGGTGVVYKAHHLKMDRSVAIKMMHSHMVARPEALKNFYEEAKTVAQLKHHNIVTLYDFGIGPDNQPFLVMDYVEGSSLKKLSDDNGPLSLEQIEPIISQIIDGLAYAHGVGVVHQDLKPENIMLTSFSNSPYKVTLVDFGMAALNMPDKDLGLSGNKKKKFVGSPHYMSPEQCLANSSVDSRSDIYSLSFVLFEALTGKLPFEAKSGMAMMDSHVREKPKPFNLANPDLIGLQVCTELTRVFAKAMAKEPENRYQTIDAFGIELGEALARDSVKWKAVKHRGIAAEQALVYAKQSSTYEENSARQARFTDNQSLDSRLQSGKQFLSRQAEIEAAYLNHEDRDLDLHGSQAPKENIILRLLKQFKAICCNSQEALESDVDKEISQCPYCQATVTPGIQFCLTCQRRLTAPVVTNKLSETRTGNSFNYNQNDTQEDLQSVEARSNIKHLRQKRRLLQAFGIQSILKYALVLALVLGGLVVCKSYVNMTKSWKIISQFVHLPASHPNTDRYRRY